MKQKSKIAIYIEQKELYKNTPFRIRNGVGYYLQGEKEIPAKEWEKTNPPPEYITSNENNPDKTYIH